MKARESANSVVRQSNFELLRIIAIIMIIAHHIAYHGGFEYPIEVVSINRLWIQFLLLGGKIGVNLFVLISGYFLISSNKTKINKTLKLWIQLFTYSVLLFVILVLFVKVEPFSIKELIKCFSPVVLDGWWFGRTYFVMYLLHPYINRLLLSFSKDQYKRYLALLLCIWCIIPTFTHHFLDCNSLLWFIVLYSLAGYYKLHGSTIACKAQTSIILSIIMILLTFLTAVLFDLIGTKISLLGNHSTWFYNMESLPILLASISLFVGFDRIRIKPSKIINTIASTTFGVYLIHENKYGRPFLWTYLFNVSSYSDSKLLIPYTLLLVVIVFMACAVIELIRKNVIERWYSKHIDYLSASLASFGNKIAASKLFEKL